MRLRAYGVKVINLCFSFVLTAIQGLPSCLLAARRVLTTNRHSAFLPTIPLCTSSRICLILTFRLLNPVLTFWLFHPTSLLACQIFVFYPSLNLLSAQLLFLISFKHPPS